MSTSHPIKKIPYVRVFERTRVLGSLLASDELEFETEPPRGMVSEDTILHISCQVHNVSHIPDLAMKLMKRLEIPFTTLGGPENCCGAFHWHFGDEQMEQQVANISLAAFRRVRAKRVLSLCPDCDYSFGRQLRPHHGFTHGNISDIFVEHLDELRKLMVHPVNRRVVIHHHEHDELRRRDARNIELLLQAVPGLDILQAPKSLGPGLHCQTLAPMPPEDSAAMFEEARALGADYLVVPYHSCYRQHCKLQLKHGVEVQYYLGLVAQAMGVPYREPFKELRMLDNVDLAMEQLRPRIANHGYSEAEVRSYVESVIYL